MNELPLFNERNTAYSSTWIRYASSNYHSYVIHSTQTVKTPPIINEWYTTHKKNDIPPHLLISIERKEKKDESTN